MAPPTPIPPAVRSIYNAILHAARHRDIPTMLEFCDMLFTPDHPPFDAFFLEVLLRPHIDLLQAWEVGYPEGWVYPLLAGRLRFKLEAMMRGGDARAAVLLGELLMEEGVAPAEVKKRVLEVLCRLL